MSLLTSVKRFFNPPAIIDLTGDGDDYPIGFFRVQTVSGEMALGFFSGAPRNFKQIPCNPTVDLGSELAGVPRDKGESLKDAIDRLPLVRLRFRSHRDGQITVGDHSLMDTEKLGKSWDGDTQYVGESKATDDNLDSGLW